MTRLSKLVPSSHPSPTPYLAPLLCTGLLAGCGANTDKVESPYSSQRVTQPAVIPSNGATWPEPETIEHALRQAYAETFIWDRIFKYEVKDENHQIVAAGLHQMDVNLKTLDAWLRRQPPEAQARALAVNQIYKIGNTKSLQWTPFVLVWNSGSKSLSMPPGLDAVKCPPDLRHKASSLLADATGGHVVELNDPRAQLDFVTVGYFDGGSWRQLLFTSGAFSARSRHEFLAVAPRFAKVAQLMAALADHGVSADLLYDICPESTYFRKDYRQP